jgi:hypothetical protein
LPLKFAIADHNPIKGVETRVDNKDAMVVGGAICFVAVIDLIHGVEQTVNRLSNDVDLLDIAGAFGSNTLFTRKALSRFL